VYGQNAQQFSCQGNINTHFGCAKEIYKCDRLARRRTQQGPVDFHREETGGYG